MSTPPSQPPPSEPKPPGQGDELRVIRLLRPLQTERLEVTDDFTRRVLVAIVRHDHLRKMTDPSLSGLVGRAARCAINLLTTAMTSTDAPGRRPRSPGDRDDEGSA